MSIGRIYPAVSTSSLFAALVYSWEMFYVAVTSIFIDGDIGALFLALLILFVAVILTFFVEFLSTLLQVWGLVHVSEKFSLRNVAFYAVMFALIEFSGVMVFSALPMDRGGMVEKVWGHWDLLTMIFAVGALRGLIYWAMAGRKAGAGRPVNTEGAAASSQQGTGK